MVNFVESPGFRIFQLNADESLLRSGHQRPSLFRPAPSTSGLNAATHRLLIELVLLPRASSPLDARCASPRAAQNQRHRGVWWNSRFPFTPVIHRGGTFECTSSAPLTCDCWKASSARGLTWMATFPRGAMALLRTAKPFDFCLSTLSCTAARGDRIHHQQRAQTHPHVPEDQSLITPEEVSNQAGDPAPYNQLRERGMSLLLLGGMLRPGGSGRRWQTHTCASQSGMLRLLLRLLELGVDVNRLPIKA